MNEFLTEFSWLIFRSTLFLSLGACVATVGVTLIRTRSQRTTAMYPSESTASQQECRSAAADMSFLCCVIGFGSFMMRPVSPMSQSMFLLCLRFHSIPVRARTEHPAVPGESAAGGGVERSCRSTRRLAGPS